MIKNVGLIYFCKNKNKERFYFKMSLGKIRNLNFKRISTCNLPVLLRESKGNKKDLGNSWSL